MTMHRHEKVIRDPVHDVIAFQLADEADRLVFELLQCREVQRLRRIRQLGFASLAYPGADHSRYSHSLGVFATARQILDRLERDAFHLPPGDRSATLAAALLHDLGHGPFSHVFERVSGIHHEGVTRRLILDDTTDVHRTLIRFETTLPERVVALLECRGHPLACDVLSSQLDADRLDYLLRDNLMTGSRYGRYDLAWLIQAMTVAERRLAIRRKGVSAAEAYLQARYHMYRHVYFHKVVRSAEGMVTLALRRARQLMLDP
ncbi:MAG: HD domain-containing protein, partial [Planctomycetota bacterium]